MTYEIRAGHLDSTLDACRARTGHPTRDAAMAALANVLRGDLVAVRADDGTYVYASQEAADRDQDGSRAMAVICEEDGEYARSEVA